MSISRYTADDYMVTAPDGEFVLFKDYAALEARCKELLTALEALSPAFGFEESIERDEGFIVRGDNPVLMAAFKLAANAIKKARGEA